MPRGVMGQSYHDMNQQCYQYGGFLAKINDRGMNNWGLELMNYTQAGIAWIGAHCKAVDPAAKRGIWRWNG